MDEYLLDEYAINKGLVTEGGVPFDEIFQKDFDEENEKNKEILEKIKTNNEE